MLSMRGCSKDIAHENWLMIASGVEPLTPDDIAETVVFVAGRRENVVVAVSLVGKVRVLDC